MPWPVVQSFRVEVRTVWPVKGVGLGVNRDLGKQSWIAQGPVDFPSQYGSKVDGAFGSVIEGDAELVRPEVLDGANAIDRVVHRSLYCKGTIFSGSLPAIPGFPELVLMLTEPKVSAKVKIMPEFSRFFGIMRVVPFISLLVVPLRLVYERVWHRSLGV